MNAGHEIVAIYEICKNLPPKEERLIVRSLKGQVRAALWHHHLNQYLDHPDFNDDQRAVIREGLDLLSTTPWSAVEPDSGDWSLKQARLREHRLHAEAVFSRRLIIELFFTFRSLESFDLDRWPD
jgi:hypothetical protein